MAARQATRRYADLASFLQDAQGTLAAGALLLPADQTGGELAPEIKLDFLLPLVGRAGPVTAQVVARLPDGSVALRLPEIPAAVHTAFKRVQEVIDEIAVHLVATGALFPKAEVDALRVERDALAAALEASRAPPDVVRAPAHAPRAQEPVEDPLVDDETELAEPPEAPALPEAAPTPLVRGLLRPDLEGAAPTLTGTLDEGTLRRGLVALALGRETGVLQVNGADGIERLGYWQRGGPVGWRSEPALDDETLGALLVRGKHITEAQRAESVERMERFGIRQGAALVQMGLVKRDQLGAILARQSEYVLTRVLQEKGGKWSFFPLPDLPEAFPATPVPVVGLLLRAFIVHAAKQPIKQVLGSLKKVQGRTVFLRDTAIAALREMRYTREEALLFDALRVSPRPVADLLDRGPIPVEACAPVLWSLVELGVVELGNAESQEAKQDRVSVKILGRKARVTQGTWFDVLDLHWMCLPAEVTAAVARVKEEFSPAALGTLSPALQADLSVILTKVDAAAQALRDVSARRAYRKTLFAEADIANCVALLRKEAEDAKADDDEARAAQCLARAQELQPD